MSAITYTFDLASSQSAAQSAPATKPGNAAALEQSYLSASAPRDVTASAPVGQEAGPGVTTLALGEEDGGGMGVAPQPGDMSTPTPDGDYQVTTLAIGEEDGGGSSSHAMSPVADDNAMIGGHSTPSMAAGDGYGEMQPIYSPGEAEYPAFAKTSQTTDLLNFHPVPRSYTATVQQTMQPAQMAPIGMDTASAAMPAPAAASPQPVYATSEPAAAPMATVDATYATIDTGTVAEPMAMGAPAEPLSGNYESVGSYEDYVARTSGTVTMVPAETVAAEPLAFEASSSEPVYEQYQPAADMTAYDNAAPMEAMPAEATFGVAVPVEAVAPEISAEPAAKPALFEKDAPLDHSGAEQAADPADGNPDYVAPVEGAKPDATYVEVPLDAYLVDPAGASVTETAPASNATSDATAPAPTAESVSMGGSFTVMDQALPESISGATSGMKAAEPEAAATGGADATDTAPTSTGRDDLSITTMAIGEEDGGGS